MAETAKTIKLLSMVFDREITWTKETPPAEKLWNIINRNLLADYQRKVFDALFPPDFQPKEFEKNSIKLPEQSKFTESEKKVSDFIQKEFFGIVSPHDKDGRTSQGDVPELNFAYAETGERFTEKMNRIGPIERLDHIGQTSPSLTTIVKQTGDVRYKISRLDHTKDEEARTVKSNLRLAIKTPKEYIERIYLDIQEFMKNPNYQFRISKKTRELVAQAMSNYQENELTVSQMRLMQEALELAVEYGKYLEFAAATHDIYTTGFGDTFQKTKARPGTAELSPNYNEDERLKNNVRNLITNKNSAFLPFFSRNAMDIELSINMIKSLASEGSLTYAGELLKAKRKFSDETVQNPFDYFDSIKNRPSLDEDQLSGVGANIEYLAHLYLPGGIRYQTRDQEKLDPIGNFEVRAALLFWAISAKVGKNQLAEACRQVGIDPNNLFIYKEEIDIGPRKILRRVLLPNGKDDAFYQNIMPVTIQPGAVKRSILSHNLLQLFHYNSPSRAALESFVQEMIASGLWGDDENKSVDSPEMSILYWAFVDTTDYESESTLSLIAPVLPWLMHTFISQSALVTESDLKNLLMNEDEKQNFFVIKADNFNSRRLQLKDGTLVATEDDLSQELQPLRFYPDVLSHKKGDPPDKIDEHSLPQRFKNVADVLDNLNLFYVINVNSDQLSQIFDKIKAGKAFKKAFLRALKIWSAPIKLGEEEVENRLHTKIEEFAATL